MRYLVGFGFALALVASPLRVNAQEVGEDSAASEDEGTQPAQPVEPAQSRLELWHPEAFAEPADATQSKGVDIEYVSRESPEMTKRRRRRAIALGVTIPIVAVVGVTAGVWLSFSTGGNQ